MLHEVYNLRGIHQHTTPTQSKTQAAHPSQRRQTATTQ